MFVRSCLKSPRKGVFLNKRDRRQPPNLAAEIPLTTVLPGAASVGVVSWGMCEAEVFPLGPQEASPASCPMLE